MIIKTLNIENFRIYYGNDYSIDLNTTNEKPFSVIVGKSGSGKTTMWQALNWCFFGMEAINDFKKTDSNWIPYSEQAATELKEKKKRFKTTVSILFDIVDSEKEVLDLQPDDTNSFRITREISYDLVRDISNQSYANDNIFIEKYSNGMLEPFIAQGDAEKFIRRLLPINIRQYYLYDGAQQDIQTLASERSKVEKAINSITGLEVAHKIVNLLKIFQNTNKAPETKSNKKLNELISQINGINKNIEENNKLINDLDLHIGDLNFEKKQIEQSGKKDARYKEVIKNVKTLNNEMNNINKKIEDNEKLIQKFFGRHSWHMLVIKRYHALSKVITAEIKSNKWPKNVSAQQVQELIDISKAEKDSLIKILSKKESVNEDTPKLIMAYLNILKDRVVDNLIAGHDVPMMQRDFDSKIQEIETHRDDLKSYRKSIIDLKTDYKAKKKEIDTICMKNNLDPDFAIAQDEAATDNPLKSLGTIIEEINKLTKRRGIYINNNSGHQSKLNDKKKEYAKEMEKNSKNSIEIKRRNFLDNIGKIIETKLDDYREENKNNVENELNNIYSKMWQDDKAIGKIRINKDYSMDIDGGAQDISSLSKGQRITLAVSFMMSISRTSTENPPPIIIDAPVGNLDGDLGEEFYDILTGNNQCIFFLLPDREYIPTSAEGRLIKKKSSHIYSVERDPSKNIAKIESIKG